MKTSGLKLLLLAAILTGSAAALPPVWTDGTAFVHLADGDTVRFKGIGITNVYWGFWQWPLSDSLEAKGDNPLIPATRTVSGFLEDVDFDSLKSWGVNAVRYEFNVQLFWADNPSRDSNVTDLKRFISTFAANGTYTVFCMSGMPGLYVQNQQYEDKKSGSSRIPSVFESDSVEALWDSTWVWLAEQLKDIDGIAAFELLNEPRLPSSNDRSAEDCVQRYVNLYQKIRAADPDRVILIPEYNSKELDDSNETVSWVQSWPDLPDSLRGVGLVSHIYTPYTFTSENAASFSSSTLINAIQKKAQYASSRQRPLFITEYGVNYAQTNSGRMAQRLSWLRTIHDQMDTLGLSSTLFTFKEFVTPYSGITNSFVVWGDYQEYESQVEQEGDSLVFLDASAGAAAVSSGFDTLLVKYFWTGSSVSRYSTFGNDPVIAELIRYIQGRSDTIQAIPGMQGRANSTHRFIIRDATGTWFQNTSNRQVTVKILDARGATKGTYSVKPGERVKVPPMRFVCKNSGRL